MRSVFGKSIIPCKYIYHITQEENDKSILKKGIEPRIGKTYGNYSKFYPGFRNIPVEEYETLPAIFCINGDIEEVKHHPGYGVPLGKSIWKIDTSKIDNEWFEDLHSEYQNRSDKKVTNITTNRVIPRKAIQKIKL